MRYTHLRWTFLRLSMIIPRLQLLIYAEITSIGWLYCFHSSEQLFPVWNLGRNVNPEIHSSETDNFQLFSFFLPHFFPVRKNHNFFRPFQGRNPKLGKPCIIEYHYEIFFVILPPLWNRKKGSVQNCCLRPDLLNCKTTHYTMRSVHAQLTHNHVATALLCLLSSQD